MKFNANFTAIDFETANRRSDSACQLAAVVVRGGEIVDQKMWMIRPEPFFFSPMNIRIHGIHPEQVEDEGSFADHWNEISNFVTGDCLIAHNAPFDIGVMLSCLTRHELDLPELSFSCTRLIAKETWPERRRFGLKPLSDWLGVQFKHHDALEDSIACARVLLAAGIAAGVENIEQLEQKLRIDRGTAGPWGVRHASKKKGAKRKKQTRKTEPGLPKRTLRKSGGRSLVLPDTESTKTQPAAARLTVPMMNPFDERSVVRELAADYARTPHADSSVETPPVEDVDWQRLLIRAEFIQPLRGKSIVFSGRLNAISPEKVKDLTTRSGGTHQSELDESTNCFVIGETAPADEALQSIRDNESIELLSESEFLALVGLR